MKLRSFPAMRLAGRGAMVVLAMATPFFPAEARQKMLFIGNSFTLGWQTSAASYNSGHIHDLDATDSGGIPGTFENLAAEGGYDVDVFIEAIPGSTLSDHLAWDRDWLGRSAWDWVILQDYSTRPLPVEKGGNFPQFMEDVRSIYDLAASANPHVKMALYETWARPNLVPARLSSLGEMQSLLHNAYAAAASSLPDATMVPVGDAFLAAIAGGVADDPTTSELEGPVNLWSSDRYHASVYGNYLSALMFYSALLDGDIGNLPSGAGSTADNLGIASDAAAQLEAIASQMSPEVMAVPEPPPPGLFGTAFAVLGITVALHRRRARL